MKQFWIYVLSTICYAIGFISLRLIGKVENIYFNIFLLLMAVTFLGCPAIKSWKKYFDELFYND